MESSWFSYVFNKLENGTGKWDSYHVNHTKGSICAITSHAIAESVEVVGRIFKRHCKLVTKKAKREEIHVREVYGTRSTAIASHRRDR
jgi:hypothetical protein